MEITVIGRKIQVTDALRERVDQKIGDALKVFDIDPITCDVVLRVEHYKSTKTTDICEVTVHVHGAVIRVEAAKEDMYAAIDEAARMTERQMRKFKTKILDRRKPGKQPQNQIKAGTQEEQTILDDEKQVLSEEDDDALVRTKYIPMTKLTEEDALVQADLLGHDFYVFEDMQTGNTHVIYHRKSGGYGILKPESEKKDQK